MKTIGIDIGSRSIEIVVLENGNILEMMSADTGHDPLSEVRRLLGGRPSVNTVATGYGRHMLEIEWNLPAVTEIRAYAVGIRNLIPGAATILDIGGQDTKAIALDPGGRIRKFEMNDRCAAGTGKFLELMARSLGYDLDSFGRESAASPDSVAINSMCAVFAESEVTSLVTRGMQRAAIGRGVHDSVAKRAVTMLQRIGWSAPIVFAGGVARNPCMRRTLETLLQSEIIVPAEPEYAGALGAALIAGH